MSLPPIAENCPAAFHKAVLETADFAGISNLFAGVIPGTEETMYNGLIRAFNGVLSEGKRRALVSDDRLRQMAQYMKKLQDLKQALEPLRQKTILGEPLTQEEEQKLKTAMEELPDNPEQISAMRNDLTRILSHFDLRTLGADSPLGQLSEVCKGLQKFRSVWEGKLHRAALEQADSVLDDFKEKNLPYQEKKEELEAFGQKHSLSSDTIESKYRGLVSDQKRFFENYNSRNDKLPDEEYKKRLDELQEISWLKNDAKLILNGFFPNPLKLQNDFNKIQMDNTSQESPFYVSPQLKDALKKENAALVELRKEEDAFRQVSAPVDKLRMEYNILKTKLSNGILKIDEDMEAVGKKLREAREQYSKINTEYVEAVKKQRGDIYIDDLRQQNGEAYSAYTSQEKQLSELRRIKRELTESGIYPPELQETRESMKQLDHQIRLAAPTLLKEEKKVSAKKAAYQRVKEDNSSLKQDYLKKANAFLRQYGQKPVEKLLTPKEIKEVENKINSSLEPDVKALKDGTLEKKLKNNHSLAVEFTFMYTARTGKSVFRKEMFEDPKGYLEKLENRESELRSEIISRSEEGMLRNNQRDLNIAEQFIEKQNELAVLQEAQKAAREPALLLANEAVSLKVPNEDALYAQLESLNQLMQQKSRFGHINTKEFRKMQEDLDFILYKDSITNYTKRYPDESRKARELIEHGPMDKLERLKDLKKHAEEYLVSKRGQKRSSPSEMRQVRLDAAAEIIAVTGDFLQQQERFVTSKQQINRRITGVEKSRLFQKDIQTIQKQQYPTVKLPDAPEKKEEKPVIAAENKKEKKGSILGGGH